MPTSWAISSNADVDDDFFSTIDKPESIWNNNDTLLAQMNSARTTNSSRSNISDSNINSNSNGKHYSDNNSDVSEHSSGSSFENQRNNNGNDNDNKIDNNNEQDDSNYRSDTEAIDVTNNNVETSIDALLAKDLNSLSFQQRESINEEIHGINVDKGKEIEETHELLNNSFVKLQIELNKLQPNEFAYNRCQQLYGDDDATTDTTDGNIAENKDGNKDGRKSYINTNELRIMFLRCELFDTPKAARRLLDFVELMYELYGDVGLQRRIRLEDLSEVERSILESGYTQILPGKDRAGRRMMVNIAHNQQNGYTIQSRLRVSFYRLMSLVEDIETQQKGAVFITWYHNVNIFDNFSTRGIIKAKLQAVLQASLLQGKR